ncbi:hypothetical protein HanPSC8_Chr05g0193171 [Helianthus annuus]|nr:hypothetical protein HanPSC8_Chr05g0193171 [Helianthus annuus]
MFFLYCLLYKRLYTLAHGLAQYFASAHHRQERRLLYGGANVTMIALSLGYHPETDPRVGKAIQLNRMGMNTLSRMHVTKNFQCGKLFKGADDQPYVPTQLPAQFELVYPPRNPEVPEHEPDMYIPEPPQPCGPPGAPQFPRHVGPGPSPSYQRLCSDVDRLTYVVEWMAVEMQRLSQREGLPPRDFVPPA